MDLTKEIIDREIKLIKTTIKTMEESVEKIKSDIELNSFILKAFENAPILISPGNPGKD